MNSFGKISISIILIFIFIFGIWFYIGFPIKIREVGANPGSRARTVQIFAGQYNGNGAGGQLANTNHNLTAFNFKLVESGVVIKNAFVVLEAQLNGSQDAGIVSGHVLAFDSCVSPCSPDPWAGAGRVEQNQGATVLQYQDVDGGMYVRLLIDVKSEVQLASYNGGGALMNFRVGYRFNNMQIPLSNIIDSVKAKLFITYIYDSNSSNLTNTVIYPLESTELGDQGTRRFSQSSGCVKNSNCPTFNYNMNIPEFSERISQWFEVGGFNDGNGSVDVIRNVNIQGVDVDSSSFYLEAAQGKDQGNWSESWLSGVSGFSENINQTLEHFHSGGVQYLIGGEVIETYAASSNSEVKTRTVSFPMGIITNNINIINFDSTYYTTVYFPESGVSIKKAWVRILQSGDDDTGSHNFSVRTKVGDNPQSAASTYIQDPGNTIITQTVKIIHIIPSVDYSELESANFLSGKQVQLLVQANHSEIDGVSAELMITYTYTGETNGYLTTIQQFAGQAINNGSSQMATFSGSPFIVSVLPETTGFKAILAAALRASYSASSQSGTGMPQSDNFLVNADLSINLPSCGGATNRYVSSSDSANAFMEFYKLVTSSMNTINNQPYNVCYTNNGAGNVLTGAKMNGWLIYTYEYYINQSGPPPFYEQSSYRWFENIDSFNVGSPLANQDTEAVFNSPGDAFRLRMLIHVGNYSMLHPSWKNFVSEGGIDEIGFFSSITAPDSNNIYISHYDVTNGDLRFCKSINAGTSFTCSSIDTANNVGQYTSITAPDSNNIYISHYDVTNGDLRFCKSINAGTSFTCSSIDTANNVGQYTSITAPDSNNIYISHYDVTNGDLRFCKSINAGTSFTCSSIDTANNVGQYTSITAPDSNNIYISHYDVTNGDLRFCKSINAGTSFTCSSIDTANNVGQYTSITAPDSNNIYISHYDVTNGDLRFCKSINAGTSFTCSSIDTANNVGQYTSITAPDSNNIYISHYDVTNGDLRFCKSINAGTSFTCSSIDTANNVGQYTSITAPDSNNIYISHYDVTFTDIRLTRFLEPHSFKLQFAQQGTDNSCDANFIGESYSDVTLTSIIAYNDNLSPNDGLPLINNVNDPVHGGHTIRNQTYEEVNNFTNSEAEILVGEDGKWDFSLKDNGSATSTSYCFRVVKSNGSLLDAYSVIPKITFASSGDPLPSDDWLADENTPIENVQKNINIRLRVQVANAGGSAGYDYSLEYASKNGNQCGDNETFISLPVTAGGEHFEMKDSIHFVNWDPTTPKLTPPQNYSFISGRMVEDPHNSSGNIPLSFEQYTEIEFVFAANNNAINGGSYCFRLTNSGSPLEEYQVFPELTIQP